MRGVDRHGFAVPHLCARLGVSRTSVREALRLLEQEGLVEVSQGRPAVVRAFDLTPLVQPLLRRLVDERDVLRQVAAVRTPLEIFVAEAAARNRSAEDLRDLRACLDEMRRKLNAGAPTLEEDVLFHDLLYKATRNSVLLLFIRTTKDLLRDVREAATQIGASGERSWSEHTAILVAVESGDPVRASAAMRRHMETVAVEQRQALEVLQQVASPSAASS